MAEYQLLEKSYINNRLYEAGEKVRVADDVVPGQHMVPLDKGARKAFAAKFGAEAKPGAVPDPIEELTEVNPGETGSEGGEAAGSEPAGQ